MFIKIKCFIWHYYRVHFLNFLLLVLNIVINGRSLYTLKQPFILLISYYLHIFKWAFTTIKHTSFYISIILIEQVQSKCEHNYCILYQIFCHFLKTVSLWENDRETGTEVRLHPLHFRWSPISDPRRLHPLLSGPQGILERPAAQTQGLWSQYSHHVRQWYVFICRNM